MKITGSVFVVAVIVVNVFSGEKKFTHLKFLKSIMWSLVVTRLKTGCWKTNLPWMNRRPRRGRRVSLLTTFQLAKYPFFSPVRWKPYSGNFWRWSFFWSACFICCQVLLFSCPILEQSPFISHSRNSKQHSCLIDSVKTGLLEWSSCWPAPNTD